MLEHIFRWIAKGIEIAGVGIIVMGAAVAIFRVIRLQDRFGQETYESFRRNLGHSILLGLEFLVAADIIATVSTKPDMDRVLVLGLVVLIRTFLSFSIQVELEGKFPWRRK